MSTRPLPTPATHPFPALPPLAPAFGGSSNLILSNCSNVVGLSVAIDITQDLVLDLPLSTNAIDEKGYTFQLNCNSPIGANDIWQQYIFVVRTPVSHNPGGALIGWVVNNWAPGSPDITPLINAYGTLINRPDTTLPAGYQLIIQLINDANNNVVGARWIINDIGVLPAPNSPLTGFWLANPRDDAGNPKLTEQHLHYIGVDGNIYERFLPPNSGWILNNLTLLSKSTVVPGSGSDLDAYAGPSGGQHVNYVATDGHVHELYIPNNGSHWVDNDLTVLSKSSFLPLANTPLDGYVDTDNGQHVNYIATDGHVHELFIASGSHWIDNDLIAKSGNGTVPRPNSPLDGYLDADNGQHVNFIGTDDHVHELYITPHGQWVNNDLNQKSNNSIPASRLSSLCGYLAQDKGQHVDYIGIDGHVHELYIHPNAQWINNDLNVLSKNSTPPISGTPLCGYWGSDNSQHVNFIGTDKHMHELYIPANGQWINNDLNALSGNSMPPAVMSPSKTSALHSFAQPDGEQNVNFIGANDGHLHELFILSGGHWSNFDLNSIQLANYTKGSLGLPTSNLAPINAFQMNLVGVGNRATSIFSSGGGTFNYAASTPFTAAATFPSPSCTAAQTGTGEKANSQYGTLPPGPSIVMTQTFTTNTTAPIIQYKGPQSPGLRLPPLTESAKTTGR